MLSVATLVLSDAYDRLNAGANLEKQRERAKQGGYLLSAPCAAAEETGACEMQVCIRSAANLPGRVDSWPRKPAPESWVKVELGGRLVCKVLMYACLATHASPLALPLATRGLRLERLATPPHRVLFFCLQNRARPQACKTRIAVPARDAAGLAVV